MKRPTNLAINDFRFVATALLVAWVMAPALAQQNQSSSDGVASDWTHHHVIFSNPGPSEDAERDGKGEEWRRIVTDPRYRVQWIKRYAAPAPEETTDDSRFDARALEEITDDSRESPDGDRATADFSKRRPIHRKRSSLHGDWTVAIGSGSPGGVALGMYAAKYTFAPIGTPACTNDFVVFPINHAGASNQANLLGVRNLYTTTCTGTVPTVFFAYNVGTGVVQTSPVLSLDGTKVAFVESVTNGSIFHVLRLGTTGSNGTSSTSPAVPGTGNNALDTRITMSSSVSVTRSSPFVDYTHDIAYVGDDTGRLHKFTGVFKGTPAEAGSPWPFTVAAGSILTGPVFDGGTSQNIFVGGSDGNLYCVTSAGAACSTRSINVGGLPVLDAPIVDSTTEKVFAAANNFTDAVLTQATTSLGSQVSVTMGMNGTDLYNGAFDHAYFTSVSTGHMYFCGNLATASTPTLYRVGFDSSGTMNGTRDSGSFQLVLSGQTGTGVDCTPLTEVFNTSQSTDFLFVGVKDHGFNTGTTNCGNQTCIMSFALPTASFPTVAHATMNANLGSAGTSGMIIDNVSGTNGASQIYFGNLQVNTGVQASQSALR